MNEKRVLVTGATGYIGGLLIPKLLTPVPMRIVKSLIGGLEGDSVVRRDEVQCVFPGIKLLGFDEAVSSSLAELHPKLLERIWDACDAPVSILKHRGFFIDYRWVHVNASQDKVFQVITSQSGKKTWIFTNHYVEINQPDSMLRLRSKQKAPGDSWIEWRVERESDLTKLSQAAFFSPRGLRGFLYWYIRRPLQKLALRRLILASARKSET